MTTYDLEIEIEAPIDYVFEWGTNPDNWARSMPGLIDQEVVEETDEGTRYRNTMKMLGQTTINEELYTVDAENHRTVSTFDDEDMKGELVFEYTEVEGGTHVRVHGEVESGTSLFDRAIQPVVSRYMKRQIRNTLRTMKELIEVEHAAETERGAQ